MEACQAGAGVTTTHQDRRRVAAGLWVVEEKLDKNMLPYPRRDVCKDDSNKKINLLSRREIIRSLDNPCASLENTTPRARWMLPRRLFNQIISVRVGNCCAMSTKERVFDDEEDDVCS